MRIRKALETNILSGPLHRVNFTLAITLTVNQLFDEVEFRYTQIDLDHTPLKTEPFRSHLNAYKLTQRETKTLLEREHTLEVCWIHWVR